MNRNTIELTLKSILLGIILSIILSAANTYLGLFAGMTVSASIPAAILSMSILRLFKRSSILLVKLFNLIFLNGWYINFIFEYFFAISIIFFE